MKKWSKYLAAGVCIAMMCGCSLFEKAPEPEELMDGIAELDLSGYVEYTFEGEYFIEKDGEEQGVEGKVDVEYTEDVYHSKESGISVTVLGTIVDDVDTEIWEDDRYRYMWLGAAGDDLGWIYDDVKNVEEVVKPDGMVEEVSADLFDDLFLEETEKEENYIVSGTIAGDDLYDLIYEILAQKPTIVMMMENAEDFADDLVFDVEAEFDYETGQLVEIEIKLNKKESEVPDEVGKLEAEMTLTFHEIDPDYDDELEIPEEVTDNPLSMDDKIDVDALNGTEDPEDDPNTAEQGTDADGYDEVARVEELFTYMEENVKENYPDCYTMLYDEEDAKEFCYSYYRNDISGTLTVSYYWDLDDAQTQFIADFEYYRKIYGDPMVETEDGMYAAEYISEDEKTAIDIVLVDQLYFVTEIYNFGDGGEEVLQRELGEALNDVIVVVDQ